MFLKMQIQRKREKYALTLLNVRISWRKPAEAKIHAEQILALEIAMSKPRFDRVERRDRRKSITR
jgi:endothelin-converting enzyme/putative endopeptidase